VKYIKFIWRSVILYFAYIQLVLTLCIKIDSSVKKKYQIHGRITNKKKSISAILLLIIHRYNIKIRFCTKLFISS